MRLIGRRSRLFLILFAGLILFVTGNSVWHSRRDRPLEIGPPTPKPAAIFVPLRPVGDVQMPLGATNAGESAFASSEIVTSAGHPSGVAYVARWRQGASLRIGSLDLASGKPLFPVVDLGAWHVVWQLAARPEGILVAGLKTSSSPYPTLPGAPRLDVSFLVLDSRTGRIRWEKRHLFDYRLSARIYPHGVLAQTETGRPALLDWTTGAARWTLRQSFTEPSDLYNTLPALTWVEPLATAPLATAADLDTSTPDNPRLAVRLGDRPWILDTRTGDWTKLTTGPGSPGAGSSTTSVLVIDSSVYLTGQRRQVRRRFAPGPRRSAAAGRKGRLAVGGPRPVPGHHAVRIGPTVPDRGTQPDGATHGPRRHRVPSEAATSGHRTDWRLRHR